MLGHEILGGGKGDIAGHDLIAGPLGCCVLQLISSIGDHVGGSQSFQLPLGAPGRDAGVRDLGDGLTNTLRDTDQSAVQSGNGVPFAGHPREADCKVQ